MGEKNSLCRLNFAIYGDTWRGINKERLEESRWEDRMARNWVRRERKQDKWQDKCVSCTEEQESKWVS